MSAGDGRAAVKLTVEFPSVSYREGAKGVARLAQAIEQIGYDHIDMFDHVVMGYPIAGRPPGPYPPQSPFSRRSWPSRTWRPSPRA